MKILLIGSGNRATAYARYFKNEIAFVYDENNKKPDLLIKQFNLGNAVNISSLDDATDFDAIIVATPDHTHAEVMEWAVLKNVPILLEKPVEVSREGLGKLYRITKNHGSGIVLGFGLRYTFMYRKILELLDEGTIGEVASIEACETLDEIHAAKFFRRWHRNSEKSGGFINTKCSHDMDILLLAANSMPRYVSSFGANGIFSRTIGNERCNEQCSEYESCIYVDDNEYIFSTADPGICPFNIDSDIIDRQSVNMIFENNITAVFTVTMHSDKGNRTIRIHGEKGKIEASFDEQAVSLDVKGMERKIFSPEDTGGSHGGGDRGLCEFFRRCYEKGDFPNQISDGIRASALALAAEEARLEHKIADFMEFIDYIEGK
jgi:predicted dehydrogenase